MERLWTDILRFIEQFVSPDWGSLIALLPLGLAGLVGLYLVWIVVRFSRAGPTRRGPRRVTPATPPGIHMPGPSWAPILGSIGTAFLLFGLVFEGLLLGVGALLLALALLFWGREAMREYDHAEPSGHELTPLDHAGPPPGVHMPGPSWRPVLASIAMTVLFFGLVFEGALLVVGFLMLIVSLVGWLIDARREYRDVEVADRTGHLPPAAAPRFPRATLAAFIVLLVGGLVIQTGLLPPRGAVGGGGEPGASASPGASPQPGSPSPEGSALIGDVKITAFNIAFETTEVTAPAGRTFTIHFVNNDPGVPHNVEIRDAAGASLYQGEIFNGVADRLYEVPALAAGAYPFICTVHPNMTGTLTAQ